jgi:hypothetical protein
MKLADDCLWQKLQVEPKTIESGLWSESGHYARTFASRRRADGFAGPSRRRKAMRGATRARGHQPRNLKIRFTRLTRRLTG